jgi:ribosome biogenesis GTPase
MARKLSQQQLRRVQNLQQKRRQAAGTASNVTDELLGPPQHGLLIMRHGRNVLVEASSGQLYTCHIRQNIQDIVAGDRVIWQQDKEDSGVVTAVEPRLSAFYKVISTPPQKPLAANVTQLIIVIAPEPAPAWELLDKYLLAAELMQLQPLLVLNKCDLLNERTNDLPTLLQYYQQLGYPALHLSTVTGEGVPQLKARLQQQISVVVGQSGVGKSSLIQLLLPHEAIKVGAISTAIALGKHTTSNARLYHLPDGGDIIDSPGVRDIEIGKLTRQQIHYGFIDCRDFIGQCKFRDCRHENEPDCAIKTAITRGDISQARYASLMKLLGTIT